MEKEKELDSFLPTFMRMDEFERRSVLFNNKIMVDPIYRILLLQEASNFEDFDKLKVDKELLKFFTKSDAFFKFFEELSGENVTFDNLKGADTYAEFDEHLDILEKLEKNYEKLLNNNGLIDKLFIPKYYKINQGFIDTYTNFELHIEGYLSNYELSLIKNISEQKTFLIHIYTSKFNEKMIKRFSELGVDLPMGYYISFDLHTKQIITKEKLDNRINATIFRCEERLEQIAVTIETIENFVRDGVPPEDIVLILPDEEMREQFYIYDKFNNLNFAMGFSYKRNKIYKQLDALYRYWNSFDDKDYKLLISYNMDIDDIKNISSKDITILEFFEILDSWELIDKTEDKIYQQYIYFKKVFEKNSMPIKSWLYLWLQIISDITIDDVRGGKITVMGVLESRGISYRRVIIVDVNEGIVPVQSSKDRFLNTTVRVHANLPIKADRENLQKYFYQRLLENAEKSVILFSSTDNTLPSKFLYELGLNNLEIPNPMLELLYDKPSKILELKKDPLVNNFNAINFTWSNTMLKSFLKCKRQFFYKYIQKLKVPSKDDINEGVIIHEVLERVFKKQKNFENSNELKQIFIKSLYEYLNELNLNDIRYSYYNLLWLKKLNSFFENQIIHINSGWEIFESEYKVSANIQGLKFTGKIDKVDKRDEDLLVIDYKTGSTRDANNTKDIEKLTDFQMSIYKYLLESKGYKNIELIFLKLFDDKNKQSEKINELSEKNEMLLNRIEELKNTKSFIAIKCDNLLQCKYCDYKLNCDR